MPVSERRPRRALIAGLAIVLASALVGCGDDEEPASATSTTAGTTSSTASTSSSTSTSSTSTTTDPTAETDPGSTAEDEVIARYLGFWAARQEANTGVPDPNHPGLAEFATGAQLESVIAETTTNLDQGVAFRPAADPHDFQRVRVVGINGTRAVVQECVVSDGVVYRRDSGEVVNDDVATHNVRGELLLVDGRWRVSSAQLIQSHEGVAGCALES